MIFPAKIESHFRRIETVAHKFFPGATVELVYLRISQFSIRIIIAQDLFVDVYYNAENGRQDYALIRGDERICGYDNLSGWHYHPLGNPERHISCKEPALENIFKEFREIVSD
jgi:hypothetical protein